MHITKNHYLNSIRFNEIKTNQIYFEDNNKKTITGLGIEYNSTYEKVTYKNRNYFLIGSFEVAESSLNRISRFIKGIFLLLSVVYSSFAYQSWDYYFSAQKELHHCYLEKTSNNITNYIKAACTFNDEEIKNNSKRFFLDYFNDEFKKNQNLETLVRQFSKEFNFSFEENLSAALVNLLPVNLRHTYKNFDDFMRKNREQILQALVDNSNQKFATQIDWLKKEFLKLPYADMKAYKNEASILGISDEIIINQLTEYYEQKGFQAFLNKHGSDAVKLLPENQEKIAAFISASCTDQISSLTQFLAKYPCFIRNSKVSEIAFSLLQRDSLTNILTDTEWRKIFSDFKILNYADVSISLIFAQKLKAISSNTPRRIWGFLRSITFAKPMQEKITSFLEEINKYGNASKEKMIKNINLVYQTKEQELIFQLSQKKEQLNKNGENPLLVDQDTYYLSKKAITKYENKDQNLASLREEFQKELNYKNSEENFNVWIKKLEMHIKRIEQRKPHIDSMEILDQSCARLIATTQLPNTKKQASPEIEDLEKQRNRLIAIQNKAQLLININEPGQFCYNLVQQWEEEHPDQVIKECELISAHPISKLKKDHTAALEKALQDFEQQKQDFYLSFIQELDSCIEEMKRIS